MSYVIGVDVGGTFTDGVLHDDDGAVVAGKAPSTPPDLLPGRDGRPGRPRGADR